MRKSDKKIDNELTKKLTDVCENKLKSYIGFQWITHVVNYADFPSSLKIICVFDNNENLRNLLSNAQDTLLRSAIVNAVTAAGVTIKNSNKLIKFDTEENCTHEHNGNWSKRLH